MIIAWKPTCAGQQTNDEYAEANADSTDSKDRKQERGRGIGTDGSCIVAGERRGQCLALAHVTGLHKHWVGKPARIGGRPDSNLGCRLFTQRDSLCSKRPGLDWVETDKP